MAINKVDPLDLSLANSPNANYIFTGNTTTSLTERYPKAIEYVDNPDVNPPLQKGKTFSDIVAEGGSTEIKAFPYGVISHIDKNILRWGVFYNENILRIYRTMEDVKNYINRMSTDTTENNEKLKNNFKIIRREIQESNSQSFEVASTPGLINISRAKLKSDRIQKTRISDTNSGLNSLKYRVGLALNEIPDASGNIIKYNIIKNINVPNYELSDVKLKQPFVRQIINSENFMTSSLFGGQLIPVKSKENIDLPFLTLNSRIPLVAPERSRKIYIQDPKTSVGYTNSINDLVSDPIELESDLIIPLGTISQLDIYGNGKTITMEDETLVSSKFNIKDATLILPTQKLEIECPNLNLENVIFDGEIKITGLRKKISIKSCKITKIVLNLKPDDIIFLDNSIKPEIELDTIDAAPLARVVYNKNMKIDFTILDTAITRELDLPMLYLIADKFTLDGIQCV